MNELQAILIVITFVAGVAAFYFAQRAAQTRGELREARELADTRQREVEETAKKLEHRASDLDQTRKQLQDTRNKMERLKKDLHSAKTQAQAKAKEEASASTDSAAGRVRITSQELEQEHRRRVEKLEAQLTKARAETSNAREQIAELRRKEKSRKAEAEKAARALLSEAGGTDEPAADADVSAEARLEATTQRLEALQHAAAARERELKKKLNQADSDARAAQKRAANNHALYLVIKGQLEVAEDRMALLRRKYEGAKRPDQLRRPSAPQPSESPPLQPANDATQDVHEDAATPAASAAEPALEAAAAEPEAPAPEPTEPAVPEVAAAPEPAEPAIPAAAAELEASVPEPAEPAAEATPAEPKTPAPEDAPAPAAEVEATPTPRDPKEP